ncbi:MAG: hypothetical protein GXC73_14425 [Chitinophagaceae bacterium]|nr:hypothetical protein [Chitinophagaceae bacterium]
MQKNKLSELDKLPPATQTGANTFGCLINGKAYLPGGWDGNHSNYRVFVDASDSSLDIRTYNFETSLKSQITFGSSGLYSNISLPFIHIGRTTLGIANISNCYIPVNDSVYRKGELKITRYDLQNGVVSGEFNCTIYKQGCTDTVRITNGRFDIGQ